MDNAKIEELFELVGIPKEMIDKPVLQLSGGQQQRVAIVRALATEHDLIIADEPTGNLDEETTQDIVNIFKDIAHKQNKTVIIVTHETAVAQETDVTFELKKKQFTEVLFTLIHEVYIGKDVETGMYHFLSVDTCQGYYF